MNPAITTNLKELNQGLQLYMRASGKTFEELLAKKTEQLGYQLRLEFRALMPGKGSVSQERLNALRTGEGVRVRPGVYAKVAQKYGAVAVAAGVMQYRTKGGALKGMVVRGGKRMNLQALAVQAELNLRESGRGFLGQAARFVGWDGSKDVKSDSRYGAWLGKAGFRTTGTGPEAKLEWGGFSAMSSDAVKGISRTRGQAAVARAISAVTEDMIPYLQQRLGVAATEVGLGHV